MNRTSGQQYAQTSELRVRLGCVYPVVPSSSGRRANVLVDGAAIKSQGNGSSTAEAMCSFHIIFRQNEQES
jgi:hypothetical protein